MEKELTKEYLHLFNDVNRVLESARQSLCGLSCLQSWTMREAERDHETALAMLDAVLTVQTRTLQNLQLFLILALQSAEELYINGD